MYGRWMESQAPGSRVRNRDPQWLARVSVCLVYKKFLFSSEGCCMLNTGAGVCVDKGGEGLERRGSLV